MAGLILLTPRGFPSKILPSFNKIWMHVSLSKRMLCSKTAPPMPELPQDAKYDSAYAMKEFGKIYDKKPFKFRCEKGKVYKWCSCGHSHYQPFCDGTHRKAQLKINLRPCPFIAPETKDYWFCNCKQTKTRPFCDGSHRHPDVQAAIR